jgi:3'-5' exoribonuclease
MWEGAEEAAAGIETGMIVLVDARVDDYKGEKQLVLASLRRARPEEYDYADFVRVAARAVEEMAAELDALVASVENPHLQQLLGQIFAAGEFRERFLLSPAAERLHHACVGGLLQHTLSVAAICREAVQVHPELDRDLLLAGALLHDVGKVWELGGDLTYDYTDAGRLFGHIVLTDRFVTRQIEQVEDFPPRLGDLLTHVLLSHHGQLDWGAPIRPALPEAMALHYADNLDAKLQIAADFLASPEAQQPGHWTKRHWHLETRLYQGPRDEEDEGQG